MSDKTKKLPFRVEPFNPQIVAANVAIAPNSGYQAQIQMVPTGLHVIVGTEVWQFADAYHVQQAQRIEWLEGELTRATQRGDALERTLPFLAAGYRFDLQAKRVKARWYDAGLFYEWALIDPWGRVHAQPCPMLNGAENPNNRQAMQAATPVVPHGTKMAAPPSPVEIITLKLRALGWAIPLTLVGTSAQAQRLYRDAWDAYVESTRETPHYPDKADLLAALGIPEALMEWAIEADKVGEDVEGSVSDE